MIGLSFDIVDNDGHKSEYPSCVVSIIPRHRSIKTENETTTTFDLIIQCCGEHAGRESFLFTQWTFNKKFHVVSSEAIVGLCFESPIVDSDILVVTDKEKWASMFYKSALVDYTTVPRNRHR